MYVIADIILYHKTDISSKTTNENKITFYVMLASKTLTRLRRKASQDRVMALKRQHNIVSRAIKMVWIFWKFSKITLIDKYVYLVTDQHTINYSKKRKGSSNIIFE